MRQEKQMIVESVIRRDGDEYVLTIPDDVMESLALHEGDLIEFRLVAVNGRPILRPELQQAAEASWERNEAVYRYLADR